MHVAVCIVGYRNAEDIAACLAALSRSTHEDFSVQICENGGGDAFRLLREAIPARLPRGQRVQATQAPGNLGYAGGVNSCVRESRDADAWWILNPDTVPDPTALEAMVRTLERGDCDIVGGVLYGPDHRVQTLGGRWRPWLARAEAIGKGQSVDAIGQAHFVEAEIDFVSGASMLVSRRFMDMVGPMREDYFLYCEEVEWCLRGRELGMTIGFAPDAMVLHAQGGTTGSGRSVRIRPRLPVYLDERNRILVTHDCFPTRIVIAAPAALALISLRFLARGAWRQTRFAVQGWWAGLLNKRGLPRAI